MRHPFLSAIALIGCVLACPALAADPGTTTTTTTTTSPRTATTAPVQSVTQTPPPGWVIPHEFQLYGYPVVLSASVLPPYDNSSFRTVGGQPATGADAQMMQER
jgi:hypothetical protein